MVCSTRLPEGCTCLHLIWWRYTCSNCGLFPGIAVKTQNLILFRVIFKFQQRLCNSHQTNSQTRRRRLRTPKEPNQSMAIAGKLSLSVTPVTHRSVALLNPLRSSAFFSSSTLQLMCSQSNLTIKSPKFRVSASSMSIDAPEKASRASFLDRRESGFLHFVKYHGLGNDFILVSLEIYWIWIFIFLVENLWKCI